MEMQISKSQFKPLALQYFREVEKTGDPIIITDRGKPVLKIVPFSENHEKRLKALRNSVVRYDDPFEPAAAPDDWDALK